MTQPTLVSVSGAIDARIMSVTNSGSMSITATNALAGTYNLILRINSDKNTLDNVFVDVFFKVIVAKWPCTPGFTAVTPAMSA